MEKEREDEDVNQSTPDPSYRNLKRVRARDRGNYNEKEDQWSPSFDENETGYVVVVETKDDETMVWETYLGRSSYEEAHRRMDDHRKDPRIIRCAVAKLIYVSGHHGLVDNRR